MATLHGKDTAVALHDQDVTAVLFNVSGTGTADVAEDHGYADDKTYKPGLMDGSVTFQGRFGIQTAASADMLGTIRGTTSGLVATLGTPHAVGAHGVAAYGEVTEAGPTANVGGIVDFSATIVEGGPSISLHDASALTAAADLASVDLAGTGTVGRANGDALVVAVVTAVTASSFTLKVQHSTDDAVWVDLVDLGSVAAVGSYGGRANLAAGVDLRRYVRGQLGGTGTSITFALAVIPLHG